MERLRWLMLGGALLLIAVLAGLLAYGRWRAMKLAREWQKRAGVTITHETNGFTYSQAIKGKTVFTLHAAKAVQHADGKWTLKDAELTLYSRTSPRIDQIYGSEFEYDQKEGIARALGEVHMDLQAPESLQTARAPQKIRGREGRAPSAGREAGESRQTIHVRTSGLVYMRSLGVAATQQDVEFRYGGVEAHARGAEFDEGESVVHLLADVHVSGEMNGQDVDLHASKADLDRAKNQAVLVTPVVEWSGRTVKAQNAVLHLLKDGSPESIDANGGVELLSGTEQVRGAQLHVALERGSVPRAAVLDGGVALQDTSATRPLQGSAQRLDVGFDAAGQPDLVTFTRGVGLSGTVWGPGHVGLDRSLTGDQVQMKLVGAADDPSRRELSEVHAQGHAVLRAESLVGPSGHGKKATPAGRKSTLLAGDDLRAAFAPTASEPVLEHLWGAGHTRMEQSATTGERQTSSADAMEVAFAPAGKPGGELQIASATELGHVAIRSERPAAVGPAGRKPADAAAASRITLAEADRAQFDGLAQRLTLTGAAQFRQAGVAVMANSIAADQRSGDAVAEGEVSTTFGGSTPSGEASHVLSEHAIFSRGAQAGEFFGQEGRPARLWHGASQVQAAVIRLDGTSKALSARPAAGGTVLAVFAGATPGPGGAGAAPGKAQPGRSVRVSSATMDYSDRTHQAVFGGGVTLRAASGDVRAARAVAFLAAKPGPAAGQAPMAAADPVAGSLQRVVATGGVRLAEPGRSGSGEQLVYNAVSDQFVLTGGAGRQPRVTDAQQGTITGSTLVVGAGDQSVVVAGNPGQGKRGRVRTETTLADPGSK